MQAYRRDEQQPSRYVSNIQILLSGMITYKACGDAGSDRRLLEACYERDFQPVSTKMETKMAAQHDMLLVLIKKTCADQDSNQDLKHGKLATRFIRQTFRRYSATELTIPID